MRRVYKNLCPAKISASIMVANMWKNSLKNVESDDDKILYETLLNFFLQRNGTYFLNNPRITTNAENVQLLEYMHKLVTNTCVMLEHVMLAVSFCKLVIRSSNMWELFLYTLLFKTTQ